MSSDYAVYLLGCGYVHVYSMICIDSSRVDGFCVILENTGTVGCPRTLVASCDETFI